MSKHNSLTQLFVSAGLTGVSGAATTYSTGATTLQYAIGGKMYTKAQVSGGASPVVDTETGEAITLSPGQSRSVVWALDAAGTVHVFAGPAVNLDADNNLIDGQAPELPAIDEDTYAPFAYQVITATSAAAAWTFGVSNWNATGLSNTVVNVSQLPRRPDAG